MLYPEGERSIDGTPKTFKKGAAILAHHLNVPIVPVAIDELKDPQKLYVFARARWAFRWIVWCSMVALLVSGVVSTYRNWPGYNGAEAASLQYAEADSKTFHLYGAGYWWLAHALFGILGLGVATALVLGRTPPRYPLVWMRINLLILLVVIFLASTTRDIRHRLLETYVQTNSQVWVPEIGEPESAATTSPTTTP